MSSLPPPWVEWTEDDLKDLSMEELLQARDGIELLIRALDFVLGERCN